MFSRPGRQTVEQAVQTNDLADDATDDGGIDDEADEIQTGSTRPTTTRSPSTTTRRRMVVESWFVDGMDHGWSGGAPGYDDSNPGGPDASRAMWAFFEGKTRTFGDQW